jgi:ribosome biogenesis protein MAK21
METFIDNLIFVKSPILLSEVGSKWYESKYAKDIPNAQSKNYEPIKNLEVINSLRDYGRKLYEQDISNYNIHREKNHKSDHSWIRNVLATGTISDKISANCIIVQDSAINNLKSLDNLIDSIKINKKRECMMSIDAVKDLFINYLLPKRELRSFHQVILI